MVIADELICTSILVVIAVITNQPTAVAVGLLFALTAIQFVACIAGIARRSLTVTLGGTIVGLAVAVLFSAPWLAMFVPFVASIATYMGK